MTEVYCAPGRRRHSAGQPDGADEGHQRRHRDHEAADAGPAEAPREALLPLSDAIRFAVRAISAPRSRRAWRSSRACAATPPAMPRRSSRSMRRAAAARSRSRRISSSAAMATICCCAISRAGVYRYPDPGRHAGRGQAPSPRRGIGTAMRIGVAYDLRSDYLAQGYQRGRHGRIR